MSKATTKATAKATQTSTATKSGKAKAAKASKKVSKKTVPALPEVVEEIRVVKGIRLPWKRVETHGPQRLSNGIVIGEDRPPRGTVLESGEVFVLMSTLYELSEQDLWDSQFGSSHLLGTWEGLALVEAGLAVEETRGGFHRTERLMEFLRDYESRS